MQIIQKGDYLATILRSPKTVFTFQDLLLLWRDKASHAANVRVNYYVKKGSLLKLRKGIYAKDENYSKLELSTRIFTPSYVSFETVLARDGVIFQYYTDIFAASYLTRETVIKNQKYVYKKVKDEILHNPAGIVNDKEISVASKERAVLDILYINNDYYFDNLRSVDWDKIFALLPIYKNKRMEKIINKLYKNI